ncbi:MAG: hypothetical protein NVSMB32_18880 [Actinomycetota bacterium]
MNLPTTAPQVHTTMVANDLEEARRSLAVALHALGDSGPADQTDQYLRCALGSHPPGLCPYRHPPGCHRLPLANHSPEPASPKLPSPAGSRRAIVKGPRA